MPEWEYLTLVFAPDGTTELDKDLTLLGEQGWELVSVAPNVIGDHVAYFKRPKNSL